MVINIWESAKDLHGDWVEIAHNVSVDGELPGNPMGMFGVYQFKAPSAAATVTSKAARL
jgi:hypothetical protein